MLELQKTDDVSVVQALCTQSAAAYDKACCAYLATNAGAQAGFCLFRLAPELTILAVGVQPEYGMPLCDGLIRAVYSYALHHGAQFADFAPTLDPALWQAMAAYGYSDKSHNDIDNFLTKQKNCKK